VDHSHIIALRGRRYTQRPGRRHSRPTLNVPDVAWTYSGVGFTATVNSMLTSFTFQNQGLADTIILVNPLGTILDSVVVPSGMTSDTVSVSWNLTAGSQYYLLQSTSSNSLYTDGGLAAPSDAEIALTDTGIFSASPVSADFNIRGTTFWAAFNNITTSSGISTTPEPASFILFGTSLLGLVPFRRKLFGR
jgi:hypothetical protein